MTSETEKQALVRHLRKHHPNLFNLADLMATTDRRNVVEGSIWERADELSITPGEPITRSSNDRPRVVPHHRS